MNFQEAETQFRQIDWQYRQGQISLEGYRAALERLRVTDAQGQTWQLQEMSGQWYVWRGNAWVHATPPGYTSATPPAALPARRPTPRKRRPVLLIGVGVLALAGVCLLAGLGGWYIFLRQPGGMPGGTISLPGLKPSGGEHEAEPAFTFTPGQSLTVVPGVAQTDPNGVGLQVPAGAVAEDQAAELSAYELDGKLKSALEQNFQLSTPFYAASAQGEMDGVGRAELSLPAPGPDARLLSVIDGTYLAVLDVLPENGALVVNPRLAPQGSAVPADPLAQDKPAQSASEPSIRYAVITPPQSTSSNAKVAAPLPADDPRDCTVPSFEGMVISLCRKNLEGSVYMEYLRTLPLTLEQADRTVDEVAAAMKRYAGLGFIAANISPSNSVHIVVFQGSGDPEYSFKTGVIYLPLDAAQSTSQPRRFELYHEMAHWIQDEEYIMLFAGASGAGRWWMETSAENMVMLLDEAAISRNMSTYGAIMGNEPLTALQSSPYQWPSDFYAHAQLVKVNMCAAGDCPISQQTFVEAINNGTYPFDDSGAQAKLTANLDDYARYLLGTAPVKANSAIPLTGPVQSGAGYGEEINVMKTTKGEFNITYDGVPPQIQDDQALGLPAAAVQASIQKDGVYPLRVTSGRDGRYPGLPAVLKIAPGAPFYYRVDGGAVQYSDGSTELVLQPIHQALGLKDVRIVALGRTGSEVFSARLEAISLEGTWLFKPENIISNSVVCSGADDDGDGDPSAFGPMLISIGSALGQFTQDAGGAGLTWEPVYARWPADVDSGDFTYNGSVLLTPEDVKLQAGINLPRQESSQSSDQPPVRRMAFLGALLPVGLVFVLRKRRMPYSVVLVLLVTTVMLSGCVDVLIYGDTTAEMSFTKLEYMGGEQPAVYSVETYPTTTPLWKLSGGQASYQMDIKIEVTVVDEEGEEDTTIETCAGTITYDLSADIFKDMVIQTDSE